MAAFAYFHAGNLYVNLTNRCPTACVFCVKKDWGWNFHGRSLSLRGEPTAEQAWAAVIDEAGLRPFDELVFCGYGEPTYRLTQLLAVSAAARMIFPQNKQRLNTIGLGSLVCGRDIVPELARSLDAVSVSLNAADEETWRRLHAPAAPFAKAGFASALRFVENCSSLGLATTVTAVAGLGVDLGAVERLATRLGARFRVRPRLDSANQNQVSVPRP